MKPKKKQEKNNLLSIFIVFFSGMTSYSFLSILWREDKLQALGQAIFYFALCIIASAIMYLKSK